MAAVVRILCATALGACGFSISNTGDAPTDVAPGTDGDPGTDGAGACFGTGLVRICPSTPLTADVVLGAMQLDTDDDGNCTLVVPQSSGRSICVVAGATVTVTGELTATGARPLVLLGATTIAVEVGGTIDVSSNATRIGAGANDPSCDVAGIRAGTGEGDSGGAGGGAGGGFGSLGAPGALGDDNDNQPPSPHKGIPGLAGLAQPLPTVLRGGCPGGMGGGGTANITSLGGEGGASGGAVSLIAKDMITIAGNVFASGAGGRTHAGPAGFMEGGGGGGSGGMIGIDAAAITITGIVAANGGAGAGGGDNDGGVAGAPGTTINYTMRAQGGAGAPCCGGDGGAGTAVNAETPSTGPIDISGGGGGGGGIGMVWSDGVITGGQQISPAPTPH